MALNGLSVIEFKYLEVMINNDGNWKSEVEFNHAREKIQGAQKALLNEND